MIQVLSQECIELFKSTPVAVRGQAALWIKKINELNDRLLERISTHLETKREAVLKPV